MLLSIIISDVTVLGDTSIMCNMSPCCGLEAELELVRTDPVRFDTFCSPFHILRELSADHVTNVPGGNKAP